MLTFKIDDEKFESEMDKAIKKSIIDSSIPVVSNICLFTGSNRSTSFNRDPSFKFNVETHMSIEWISDFIYKSYVTFFLEGLVYGSDILIIGESGEVEISSSVIHHVPSRYTQYLLSSYIRKFSSVVQFPLTVAQRVDIYNRCADDFTFDYLAAIPYVARLFSTSSGKVQAYAAILDINPSEMCTSALENLEVQSLDPEIVVIKKLEEVRDVCEENELCIVDDVGLETELLNGFPGTYVKDFMLCNSMDQISRLLCKQNSVIVTITVGVGFKRNGEFFSHLAVGRFRGEWRSVPEPGGFGFDPHVFVCGQPFHRMRGARQSVYEWARHRLFVRYRNKVRDGVVEDKNFSDYLSRREET